MTAILPHPTCPHGYTQTDLRHILGHRYNEFAQWMDGQTLTLCNGLRYNYQTRTTEPTECDPPHGVVTHAADLAAFLRGRGPLD